MLFNLPTVADFRGSRQAGITYAFDENDICDAFWLFGLYLQTCKGVIYIYTSWGKSLAKWLPLHTSNGDLSMGMRNVDPDVVHNLNVPAEFNLHSYDSEI